LVGGRARQQNSKGVIGAPETVVGRVIDVDQDHVEGIRGRGEQPRVRVSDLHPKPIFLREHPGPGKQDGLHPLDHLGKELHRDDLIHPGRA
jgi:hypothetical protein